MHGVDTILKVTPSWRPKFGCIHFHMRIHGYATHRCSCTRACLPVPSSRPSKKQRTRKTLHSPDAGSVTSTTLHTHTHTYERTLHRENTRAKVKVEITYLNLHIPHTENSCVFALATNARTLWAPGSGHGLHFSERGTRWVANAISQP